MEDEKPGVRCVAEKDYANMGDRTVYVLYVAMNMV